MNNILKNNNVIDGGFMKHLFKILLLSLIIFGWTNSNGQSFKLGQFITDNYPEITVEFQAKDANGEIRAFNANDFIIQENCPNTKPKYVICPPPGQSKFSLILTLDNSTSMFEQVPLQPLGVLKKDLVISAVYKMLKSLPDKSRWECAVVMFSSNAVLAQDFTNDTSLISKAVVKNYKNPVGQTDYNAGFLYSNSGAPGALEVAKRAKYKPIVLFLTDGVHSYQTNTNPPRINVWTGQILAAANADSIKATIFTFTLGFPMTAELSAIATGTQYGEAFAAQLSQSELEGLFSNIITKAGSLGPPAPCQLVWETCCVGGNLKVTYSPLALSDSAIYNVNSNLKPFLEVVPTNPFYGNKTPGSVTDIPVTITARKNFIKLSSPFYTSSDLSFTIKGLPTKDSTLKKDEPLNLLVSYTALNDRIIHASDIRFVSSACDYNLLEPTAGWIYENDVNVGASTLGTPKTVDIDTVICNNTGRSVKILKLYTSGGDAGDFVILAPSFPADLAANECLKVTFKFTPSANGTRTSTLIAETELGKLTAKITGSGSGFAEIDGKKNYVYANTNCQISSRDTIVSVTNPGALDLNITNISLSNSVDFSKDKSAPQTIKPGEKLDIKITFDAKSAGSKSTVLSIESNANGQATYNINISGNKDSLDFVSSLPSIDFGDLCVGETKDIVVKLTNTGLVTLTVSASDNGSFTLPIKSWTIPASGVQDVTISFTGNSEQLFNTDITFTDGVCNIVRKVNVKANVVSPKISYTPLSLTSTVGVPASGKITITNTSTRNLIVSTATASDPQIKYVPAPNWNIPAGGTFDVTVIYTPSNSTLLKAVIKLQGSPCNFDDSLLITGNPDLAIGTLMIDKHTGYPGFSIDIPIHLINTFKLAESKATGISTRVTYDQTMLTYKGIKPSVTVTNNIGSIDIDNMLLSGMSGNVLATLTFDINNSANITTALAFSNNTAIGGQVNISNQNGEFILNPVTVDLEVVSMTAKAGESVNLVIKIKNSQNLNKAVHQSISTKLIYNYSLLEPIGTTPQGTFTGVSREIVLTLPADATGTTSFPFRAMLGNAVKTDLLLSETKLQYGSGTFNTTNGQFSLDGICVSNGPRLFDPKGVAQITSINPNPADGKTSVMIETQEEGLHSVSIYSSIGLLVNRVFHGDLKIGVHELTFDASEISNGSYFIIFETPTKTLTQMLGVMK